MEANNSPTRVLLVEDDKDDYEIVRNLLSEIPSRMFHLEWVTGCSAALDALAHDHFDVCLLDYRLGQSDGLDLLRAISGRAYTIPVILLTGQGDHKVDLEAMKAGAHDYLPKSDLNSDLLERAIRYAMERAKAMEAIKKSEIKYRGLYESMMDGYVVVDMDGVIQAFNDSYRAMTGYSPEELRKLTYRDITPDKSRAMEQWIIEEQVLIRGYSELYEKEYRRKDGTLLPVELRTFLLKDELGKNIGMWAIVRDITTRKQIELELQKLREELAHAGRVSMLGEITSALAHEINQPLAAILANAEVAKRFLFRETVDTKEIAEILDDIIRDDKRASDVVSKVRAFVKKEKLRHEPLDLNLVIHQLVDLIRSDTLLQGLSIAMDLSPDPAMVHGDSIQLQQVILNLILNGAAAMREVTPDRRKIVVRTTMLDGRTVKASVTDFGTGVDEGQIKRIFEPFYTTKAEGLGVGLSISQTIIKDHGGNMEASNNQEGGAVFSFILPAL